MKLALKMAKTLLIISYINSDKFRNLYAIRWKPENHYNSFLSFHCEMIGNKFTCTFIPRKIDKSCFVEISISCSTDSLVWLWFNSSKAYLIPRPKRRKPPHFIAFLRFNSSAILNTLILSPPDSFSNSFSPWTCAFNPRIPRNSRQPRYFEIQSKPIHRLKTLCANFPCLILARYRRL